MNNVIVITSCARDKARGYHKAIRDTWGKQSPLPFYFILGSGNVSENDDELVFGVPDNHAHCTFKTRAAHKWAAENGYDFVLQAFTDTYLNLPAILSSDFESYDYTGCFRGAFNGDEDFRTPDARGWYAYASGGMGYWTSQRAAQALGQADIEGEDILMSWAEDLWTGTALGRAGIHGHHDHRYRLEAQWFLDYLRMGKIAKADIFSLHLGRGTGVYNPQWMYEAHNAF